MPSDWNLEEDLQWSKSPWFKTINRDGSGITWTLEVRKNKKLLCDLVIRGNDDGQLTLSLRERKQAEGPPPNEPPGPQTQGDDHDPS